MVSPTTLHTDTHALDGPLPPVPSGGASPWQRGATPHESRRAPLVFTGAASAVLDGLGIPVPGRVFLTKARLGPRPRYALPEHPTGVAIPLRWHGPPAVAWPSCARRVRRALAQNCF